ncbi:transcription factor DIVARICATA-like [Daucus carota subsp. sativus]|uniref:transcription factor DIVARICATA-like n=1 Tax=Daucus carota subsp. sativus TaxID=79200 RepID=UPI0007F039A2|nr:PREDICTED: transcription factor DIVARICATA-like [Daucus carota subsp. sativus]
MDNSYIQEIPPHQNENDVYTADGWTFKDVKLFETIMLDFEENGSLQFFERVALVMPWKTIASIKLRYQTLMNELKLIRSSDVNFEGIVMEDPQMDEEDSETIMKEELKGKTPRPKKRGIPWTIEEHKSPDGNFEDIVMEDPQVDEEDSENIMAEKLKGKTPTPKKRGIPWTTEEHKSFSPGLETYGKGDWKKISQNFVSFKTPSQAHASLCPQGRLPPDLLGTQDDYVLHY